MLLAAFPAAAQDPAPPVPPPAPQNPSPMVEHTRAHERVERREPPGARFELAGLLRQPVKVFVPERARPAEAYRLVIHFHGDAFVPEYAVSQVAGSTVLATVHLGVGSGVYEQAFTEPAVFDSLLAAIHAGLRRLALAGGAGERGGTTEPGAGRSGAAGRIVLSGYSAGHGAIRAILREDRHFARVDDVLLLDGLHTGYLPPGTVLAEGGELDAARLEPFERFARAAMRGEKRLLVTHSEIFPGTFASTTETTDHLLGALGLRRTPVLRWGPLGMQLLGEVSAGRFRVLGFAGNSAPDHVDHFHGMYHFLRLLQEM